MYEYGSLAQADAKRVHHDGACGEYAINKSNKEVRPAECMLDKAKSACYERVACKEGHQPLSSTHGGCRDLLWGKGLFKAQYGSKGMCGMWWVVAQKV